MKPEFIDGISTKGVRIYQTKDGATRYRVTRNYANERHSGVYTSFAGAIASLENFKEHQELLPPYKITTIKYTRGNIDDSWCL